MPAKNIYQVRAKFEKKVASSGPSSSFASSSASENSVKLPKLDLPSFSGRYTEWMSFIDLFTASVDSNRTLSDAQKLQYLKTSVKEEPHRLISSLTITNTNYSVALNILRKRYENKKVIVREHIHSIVSFNAIKSENPTLLRKLIETTDKNASCLQNLGVGAESWDPILIHLVTERLDAVTRKDWEHPASENSGTDLPSYSDLKTFVEKRATALEAAYSKVQTPKTQKSLVAHVAAHGKCPCCKDTHKIYACQKFIASPIAKRKEFVRTNNLCFNCLSHVHQSRNCTSASTCRHCKKRHHSLIYDESTAVISSTDQTSQSFQLRYSNSQTIFATALVSV